MEYPLKPPTLAEKVTALESKVAFLEQRLNNWIAAKVERRGGRRDAPEPKARLIPAKFNGRCATCREPYAAGDRVQWIKVDNVSYCWHEACEAPGMFAEKA